MPGTLSWLHTRTPMEWRRSRLFPPVTEHVAHVSTAPRRSRNAAGCCGRRDPGGGACRLVAEQGRSSKTFLLRCRKACLKRASPSPSCAAICIRAALMRRRAAQPMCCGRGRAGRRSESGAADNSGSAPELARRLSELNGQAGRSLIGLPGASKIAANSSTRHGFC